MVSGDGIAKLALWMNDFVEVAFDLVFVNIDRPVAVGRFCDRVPPVVIAVDSGHDQNQSCQGEEVSHDRSLVRNTGNCRSSSKAASAMPTVTTARKISKGS